MAFEYTALDPDGAPFTIPAGEPFKTYWVAENGQTRAEEYAHPWNVLDLWDDAELAAFGVTKTTVADPPPPRRLIPKSVVQERTNTVGKLGAVFAILNSQPIYFARWFAPNWPNVYADDAGLLTVLAAAGCSAGEITTITAA